LPIGFKPIKMLLEIAPPGIHFQGNIQEQFQGKNGLSDTINATQHAHHIQGK
jgi:hypothetical protein